VAVRLLLAKNTPIKDYKSIKGLHIVSKATLSAGFERHPK
jgi:hypothetical protein